MKFKELEAILGQISANSATFDSYKHLRPELRRVVGYLKSKYPPRNDLGFGERDVPTEDLQRIKPLYEEYRAAWLDNTDEDIGELEI